MTNDTCTECLRDAADLTELQGDRWLCRECLWEAAEHARDMREMADDDRAHAMRESAMEDNA